jgi:glycosyltransferase involved in cell wall biosynthesis
MQLKNKKILLISNEIFHYRVPIYNYFFEQFLKHGYEFNVIANTLRESREEIKFNFILEKFSYLEYKKIINFMNPSFVIIFLHLKDFIIWPLAHWLKYRRIPLIYWNHGVNLQDRNNPIKNLLYKYIHNISDSIILYSKNELKYISNINKGKVFIANNTLYFDSLSVIKSSKSELKKRYNIPYRKITLFVGRINSRKRLTDLLQIFKKSENDDYGLLIIGPGLSRKDSHMISKSKNIKYIGPIYDQRRLNEFFKISDVFCIPGANGLGLVQAFYWGLPAVTENVLHSPEIIYLKDNINGFIVKKGDLIELKKRIWFLLENDDEYSKFSGNARNIILEEGCIRKMFDGFMNSIKYIEGIKKGVIKNNIKNFKYF